MINNDNNYVIDDEVIEAIANKELPYEDTLTISKSIILNSNPSVSLMYLSSLMTATLVYNIFIGLLFTIPLTTYFILNDTDAYSMGFNTLYIGMLTLLFMVSFIEVRVIGKDSLFVGISNNLIVQYYKYTRFGALNNKVTSSVIAMNMLITIFTVFLFFKLPEFILYRIFDLYVVDSHLYSRYISMSMVISIVLCYMERIWLGVYKRRTTKKK